MAMIILKVNNDDVCSVNILKNLMKKILVVDFNQCAQDVEKNIVDFFDSIDNK